MKTQGLLLFVFSLVSLPLVRGAEMIPCEDAYGNIYMFSSEALKNTKIYGWKIKFHKKEDTDQSQESWSYIFGLDKDKLSKLAKSFIALEEKLGEKPKHSTFNNFRGPIAVLHPEERNTEEASSSFKIIDNALQLAAKLDPKHEDYITAVIYTYNMAYLIAKIQQAEGKFSSATESEIYDLTERMNANGEYFTNLIERDPSILTSSTTQSVPSSNSSLPPQAATPKGSIPFAKKVPGRPGLVYSPYLSAGSNQVVDVTGLNSGQTVKCPYTGKIFRVP